MTDLYEQIKGDRGRIESFLGKIPGYKGYKEKEMRREADKLLRDTLARRLQEQWRRLPDIQKQLLSSAQIQWLDDIEGATMKLQLFIDRLKTATYGYAGFFDAVRVKEDELDQLYNFDLALGDQVDEITAAVDALSSAAMSKEGIGEAIARLNSAAVMANETFGRRQDVITGTETI
jgi:hypothetical protein